MKSRPVKIGPSGLAKSQPQLVGEELVCCCTYKHCVHATHTHLLLCIPCTCIHKPRPHRCTQSRKHGEWGG